MFVEFDYFWKVIYSSHSGPVKQKTNRICFRWHKERMHTKIFLWMVQEGFLRCSFYRSVNLLTRIIQEKHFFTYIDVSNGWPRHIDLCAKGQFYTSEFYELNGKLTVIIDNLEQNRVAAIGLTVSQTLLGIEAGIFCMKACALPLSCNFCNLQRYCLNMNMDSVSHCWYSFFLFGD